MEVRYPGAYVTVSIHHSYANMKPVLDQHPDVLKRVEKAYKTLNLPLTIVPIRGGTDGANLTFKGVPTPNLATGGYNYHGKFEYLVIQDAEKMVEVIQEIVRV
jgi:tripeptide aminopeptidase